MTMQRITVDRIALTLDGLPAAQAELVAAQLQAALSAQPWPADTSADPAAAPAAASTPDISGDPGDATLETRLAGPELVHAVAARLMDLIGQSAEIRSPQEVPPWP